MLKRFWVLKRVKDPAGRQQRCGPYKGVSINGKTFNFLVMVKPLIYS
jgi:hypothetical protein